MDCHFLIIELIIKEEAKSVLILESNFASVLFILLFAFYPIQINSGSGFFKLSLQIPQGLVLACFVWMSSDLTAPLIASAINLRKVAPATY